MSTVTEGPIRVEVDVSADIRKRLSSRRRIWTFNRLLVAGVFLVIYFWQARYASPFRGPMFGWPVCHENLFYLGRRGEYSWPLFFLDAFLWLAIALSVLEVVRRVREARRIGALHRTFKGVLYGLGVVAMMIGLALAEQVCEDNAEDNGRIRRHGRIEFAPGYELWIDSDLFTAALDWRLPLRLAVLGFVACYVYCLLLAAEQFALRIRSSLDRLGRRKSGDANSPT
jgi:hypothetical protein